MTLCSCCGEPKPLAKSNRSRVTGEWLFRTHCVDCQKVKKASYFQARKDHYNAKSKQWAAQNPDRTKLIHKRSRNRPEAKTLRAQWVLKNKDRFLAMKAKRCARRKEAQPKSLTEWDKFYIQEIYHIAKLRGLTVDHIIPLQHDLVCGLHVPENMQLMTLVANSSKSNKFEII